MLIDEFLPTYEVSERHERLIPAPPAVVYSAVRSGDLGRSWLVRALLAMRSAPGLLGHRRRAVARLRAVTAGSRLTIAVLLEEGFALLAEEAGREVVLGLVGRFWTPSGGIVSTDAEGFRGPLRPGLAQAAWNFVVAGEGAGRTRLVTETRVHCADAATLRTFRRYWWVIGPFSGLIRQRMLASIAREVEAAGYLSKLPKVL